MIVRESYSQIALYAPDRSPCATDLSDNTNLWGIPPEAARIIANAGTAMVARYPSLYAPELKQALAQRAGVTADMVVTGCGSDDVLDSAIRAFTMPGDRIAIPDPSFAMMPILAQMNGLEPVLVPLEGGTKLDANAMLATKAKLVYLCSPNNPTGNILQPDAVERVVREAPGVVILDEAYAEFAGADARELLQASDNLLLCRTMSKAYGLAGLRVGYALGSPKLCGAVERSRGPYKVSALAERAALAVLSNNSAWVDEHVDLVIGNRSRVMRELLARSLAPLSSSANFILLPVKDADTIATRMRSLGVAVRPFSALPHIGNALRFTVGPWEMMELLLNALDEAISCS